MIFIKVAEEDFPHEVREEARRLTDELQKLTDSEARAKFIDKHSDFWRRKVRPILMKISHGKCWYSEARDIANIWHVDHFRPKGNVRDADGRTRPGYWWLAFKLSNYRLSGQVMNTVRRDDPDGPLLGKWDRFPLLEGSYIAHGPGADENLEASVLLDPCRDQDWALITFDELGRPVPNCEEDELDYTRVKISIELLHLDFEPLNEERRRVWNECEQKITDAAVIMRLSAVERAFRHAELNRIFNDIRSMISEDAELSAVARACLLHSEFKWARTFASTPGLRRAVA